jgi:hypothetical protein
MHAFSKGSLMVKAASSARTNTKGATQPPSRAGRTGVTFYLKPDAMKQLRFIGVEENSTLQGLMIEATNMLFKSRGKAEVAK